jgi:hypothetical protein
MSDYVELMEWVVVLWVIVFLFITCPVWLIPFLIYTKLREEEE